MVYVVDAHALIWFLEDNPRLGPNARSVLQDPHQRLVIPAIALAEACWIVERGRTSVPSVADLLAAVAADARVTVAPLDRSIIERSGGLVSIREMHDRQTVATALLLRDAGNEVAILTRDENITESRLIPVIW